LWSNLHGDCRNGATLLSQRRTHALLYGQDLGVLCQGYTRPLWSLGYPEQARKRGYAAMTLAEELKHPFSLAFALNWLAGVVHRIIKLHGVA
jgi:hypothetical protein